MTAPAAQTIRAAVAAVGEAHEDETVPTAVRTNDADWRATPAALEPTVLTM